MPPRARRRDDIRGRRIHHHHAARRRLRHIDVVQPMPALATTFSTGAAVKRFRIHGGGAAKSARRGHRPTRRAGLAIGAIDVPYVVIMREDRQRAIRNLLGDKGTGREVAALVTQGILTVGFGFVAVRRGPRRHAVPATSGPV